MTDDEIREYLQDIAEACHDMINVVPDAIEHRQKHLGIIDRLDQKDARIASLAAEVERLKEECDLRMHYASYLLGCAMSEDFNPDDYETFKCSQ